MSIPTEIYSGTVIDHVRLTLGNIGRVYRTIERDEPQVAITTAKLYTDFHDISDVVGIWDNYSHSGTNYALSGTFNSKEGEIATGTAMTMGNEYYITYVHQEGLTDRTITQELSYADTDLQMFLYTLEDLNLDTTTAKGLVAYNTKIGLAALRCVDVLNNANIVQAGFNYAIGEVRIETKLWGEGMSAEVLINRIERRINQSLSMLKLIYSGKPIINVLDRTVGEPRYDKNRAKRMITSRSEEWMQDGIRLDRQFKLDYLEW
jgi:hypothetical protein